MKLNTVLYIVAIILLNIASTTMFFRIDLTENRSYSLSKSSQALVGNLEEPLTIKVFLSENLPVPYNTLERDIRDILGEYQLKANKHFNYTIDLIKKDEEPSVSPETYGITEVTIRSIEQDEMKAVSAYIGMTFIHGDLTETIPAIQYNENLEFVITNTIRKMTEKTTFLLSMEENIKVKLIVSPILKKVSNDFVNYKSSLESVINELNKDYFNRVSLELIEPSTSEIDPLVEKYSLNKLSLGNTNGGSDASALASIVLEGKDEIAREEIVTNDIFGRTVIVQPEQLKDRIKASIDKMIGAGTTVGYLVSNGTINFGQNQQMFFQQQDPGLNSLKRIISEGYNLVQVDLADGEISDDIKTLIIARPKNAFTERELYLLDQFVMKGNSLLVAIDNFEADMQAAQYGQEKYNPINHGLKDFLNHHGIIIEDNIVMDEESFKQVQRDNRGSIVENQIYFAPMIKGENINRSLSFLNGVNELLTFKMSEVRAENPEDKSVKTLFSTSDNSWISTLENITLNPNRIIPPSEKQSYSVAALKDSDFVSYFNNREIPAKEYKEFSEDNSNVEQISGVDERENLIKESQIGSIMVVGSSEVFTDQLITGDFPSNILMIQNTLDYLSGRGDYTEMRSKGVFNRPMDDTKAAKRNFIKYFNIIGLPILVALAGLISYLLWIQKKRKIMAIFQGGLYEK